MYCSDVKNKSDVKNDETRITRHKKCVVTFVTIAKRVLRN